MNEIFEEFQQFRRILCVCPCCGEIVRVSDLKLKTKGTAIKTWLDEFQDKAVLLKRREERFDERKDLLREVSREKGRKEAKKVFNKAILPALKNLKFDPYDIIPILNPVDFIVFKGMNKRNSISEVIMLSKTCNLKSLCNIRKQVKQVIIKENYDWQTARIDDSGNITFE
jgi:predicted Holliday junction resolvase-like endonuclease